MGWISKIVVTFALAALILSFTVSGFAQQSDRERVRATASLSATTDTGPIEKKVEEMASDMRETENALSMLENGLIAYKGNLTTEQKRDLDYILEKARSKSDGWGNDLKRIKSDVSHMKSYQDRAAITNATRPESRIDMLELSISDLEKKKAEIDNMITRISKLP